MPTLTPPLNPRVLARQLTAALVDFRKHANGDTGPDLDVRVVADLGDETWWLATGDVQYDTVHGDLCAAASLHCSMTPEEVAEVAKELCTEIDEQAVDFADSERQGDDTTDARDVFPSDCADRD